MVLHFLSLTILSSLLLHELSLCAPASVLTNPTNPTINPVPIHVPICLDHPGGYDLLVCARLLVALKKLPYYYDEEIWSEFVKGDGHLPAIFSLQDQYSPRSCHLSMDLYEPGIPKTAKERFSLARVHVDLTNIYFECLKTKRVGGFNRIGFLGNVAALLGPSLDPNNPLLAHFQGLSANQTNLQSVHMINMTAYNEPDIPTERMVSDSKL